MSNKLLSLRMDNWVFERLAEPFPVEELNWRTGGGGTYLAYLDARQIVERLNEIVGAENWNDSYTPVTLSETEIRDVTNLEALKERVESEGRDLNEVFWIKGGNVTGLKDKSLAELHYHNINYGGMQCDLTVLDVTKSDVGSPSYAEQIKGATSDALKRAAVKFGIGQYLYGLKNLRGGKQSYGRVTEAPELPEWAYPIDRPDPDEVIKSKIEEYKEVRTRIADLEENANHMSVHEIDRALDEVHTMGYYDPSSPLVVKRAVYELLIKAMERLNE